MGRVRARIITIEADGVDPAGIASLLTQILSSASTSPDPTIPTTEHPPGEVESADDDFDPTYDPPGWVKPPPDDDG